MRTQVAPVFALGGFVCSAGAAAAAVPLPCSFDTFAVDGSTLTIRVCDVAGLRAPGPPAKLRTPASAGELQETVAVAARTPLVRGVRYVRPANDETARALDDVPLGPLGIERTLHVVLSVRNGIARLEHAMLVPGAVSLK